MLFELMISLQTFGSNYQTLFFNRRAFPLTVTETHGLTEESWKGQAVTSK